MAVRITTKPKGAENATILPLVIKADTYLVVADAAKEPEDEFMGLYFTTEKSSNVVLQPPYEPCFLERLPTLNNTLNQCVEVMEVNIDGTGHEFEPVDKETEPDQTEMDRLNEFFNEPYPGRSFVSIRRKLRRELESIGWGFLEILRNAAGDIVGLRNVISHTFRLVRLDMPTMVTKEIMRDGALVNMEIAERERRFVQRIGTQLYYFREFGSSRNIDKFTGEWETPGALIPLQRQGSELLFFTVNDDVETAYGVPRWINQLPAILGSRKAEEQNLEFFDAGGVPPAIVFVQGGVLAGDMSQQLKLLLSGQTRSRNRVAVVEAQSTSGSTDTAGNVRVTVERFGAESVQDSLYQAYDSASADKVRTGFRIPPLFLGKADDYNFATALTAYMTAEAQVFQPERTEFDEIINKTILKAMEIKTVKFRSIPISMKNLDAQLTALGLIKGMVKPDSFVEEVNQITGMSVEYDPVVEQQNQLTLRQQAASADTSEAMAKQAQNPQPAQAEEKKQASVAFKSQRELMDLAQSWCKMNGFLVTKYEVAPNDKRKVMKAIKELGPAQEALFLELCAAHMYGKTSKDAKALIAGHCEH